MGWICFTPQPCRKNDLFHPTNLPAIDLRKPKMRIRGKMVHFEAEAVNNIYHLPDHDMDPFRKKDHLPGEWLASQFCPGVDVPWAVDRKGITSKEFTVEAKIWLAIICSRVSLVSNVWNVPILRALMVACILNGTPLNVGEIFVNELKEYRRLNGTSLLFPSLITELCQLAGVKEDPEDNWVEPGKPINPLKKRGEGGVVKGKERKSELPP